MKSVAPFVVAVCLLAASGVRAHDVQRRDRDAPQLVTPTDVVAVTLAPRRHAGSERGFVPFTIPVAPQGIAAPRGVAEVLARDSSAPGDGAAPARNARGPPHG